METNIKYNKKTIRYCRYTEKPCFLPEFNCDDCIVYFNNEVIKLNRTIFYQDKPWFETILDNIK